MADIAAVAAEAAPAEPRAAAAGGGGPTESPSGSDADEEICRICRCPSEEGKPLFHPCICTGSIKFVHEDCLLEWLAHSGRTATSSASSKCELCGHSFGFTPVYEAGAPQRLSLLEVSKLSALRGARAAPLALRFMLVLVTWGGFIPVATCVMFRILSLGKLDRTGQLQAAYEAAQSGWASFFLRLRHALEGGYYNSWGIGVCVCASIVLSFLTLISVVDFVREHDLLNPEEEEEPQPPPQLVPLEPVPAPRVPEAAALVPPEAAAQVPPVAAAQVPPVAAAQVPPMAVALVPPVAAAQVPPVAAAQVPPVAAAQVPPMAAEQVPPVVAAQLPQVAAAQVPPPQQQQQQQQEAARLTHLDQAARAERIDEVESSQALPVSERRDGLFPPVLERLAAVPSPTATGGALSGETDGNSAALASRAELLQAATRKQQRAEEVLYKQEEEDEAALGGGMDEEEEEEEENEEEGEDEVEVEEDDERGEDDGEELGEDEQERDPEEGEQEEEEEEEGGGGGGFLDGVDAFIEGEDADQNVGDLNVAMDELLGLRGPGWVLFHNVLWLLTFNGLYLCIALFAPTTCGSLLMSLFARFWRQVGGGELLSSEDEAFLVRTLHKLRAEQAAEETERVKYLVQQHGPWRGAGLGEASAASSPATRFSASGLLVLPESAAPGGGGGIGGGGGGGAVSTGVCRAADRASQLEAEFFGELHLAGLEFVAVLLGYIMVALALAALHRASRHMRDRAAAADAVAAAPGGIQVAGAPGGAARRSWRRIARVLGLMSRTFKVLIIVFLKMGLFPVLLGALLERAGRDVVSLGEAARYEFVNRHPIFAIMVLWVAGITHMLIITVVVLELRDVLHPDILHGIVRPKDAEQSLLRTVLEDSVPKHLRRMALSCAIYTLLVAAFVALPARALKSAGYGLGPGWSPHPYSPALHYTVLELQLPVELMAIHVGVLNVLDHGKGQLRDPIESWFRTVCKALGLTAFLLPVRAEQGQDAPQQEAPVRELLQQAAQEQLPQEQQEPQQQEQPRLEQEQPHQLVRERAVEPADPAANAGRNAAGNDDDNNNNNGAAGAAEAPRLLPRSTPPLWLLRTLVLVVLAWATALVVTCVVVALPLLVGRAAVALLQVPLIHEPLVYGVGCIVLWRLLVGAAVVRLHRLPTHRLSAFVSDTAAFVSDTARSLLGWRDARLHSPDGRWRSPALKRTAAQWLVLGMLALVVSPWLMGAVLQLSLLLPAAHPGIVGPAVAAGLAGNATAAAAGLLWSFPRQLHALLVALSGHARAVGAEELLAAGQAASLERAAVLAEGLQLSASPLHDWMVGLLVEAVLLQLLLLPDLVEQREGLLAAHRRFTAAAEDMVRGLDCSAMLREFVLPVVAAQVAAVLLPLLLAVPLDLASLATASWSAAGSVGLINLFRRAAAALFAVVASPFVLGEARRTWRVVHDALRDERYLIGKRLHNLDRAQRRLSQRPRNVF